MVEILFSLSQNDKYESYNPPVLDTSEYGGDRTDYENKDRSSDGFSHSGVPKWMKNTKK